LTDLHHVGIVLSGGNVDLDNLPWWCQSPSEPERQWRALAGARARTTGAGQPIKRR